MVYRLSKMSLKTKALFFCMIWIFSAITAIIGVTFIATAAVIPGTPYEIRANPLISSPEGIRQKMGNWVAWNYIDEEGTFYFNVKIVETRGRLEIETNEGASLPEFKPHRLEEIRENGSVVFIEDVNILVYFADAFPNPPTVYEVSVEFAETIWVDLEAKQLKINYQPGKQNPIYNVTFETETTTDKIDRENIGNYFIIRNRPFSAWLNQVFIEIKESLPWAFVNIGQILLFTVAVGGAMCIITAFIVIFLRIVRICGSRFWTYTLLRALNGRFGKLISLIPVFDFAGDTYVEESFVNVIDLSGLRSTLSELYRERAYDLLFFPTALAAILTVVFVQNFPGEDKLQALIWSPILSPIVLIVLLFYFPMIWSFNEGGFKRLEISQQGDVVSVKPLGKILRDGLGIMVGFSGIISLGALAVSITVSFAGQTSSAGSIQVAGFSLDLFSILLLILWTVGLFFILQASIIVGASLIALNYLQTTHLNTIRQMREKSEKDNVISNFGSLAPQFKPKAIETIYTTDDDK